MRLRNPVHNPHSWEPAVDCIRVRRYLQPALLKTLVSGREGREEGRIICLYGKGSSGAGQGRSGEDKGRKEENCGKRETGARTAVVSSTLPAW